MLVSDERGVVVKSAGAFKRGDRMKLLFADGQVDADIIKVTENKI